MALDIEQRNFRRMEVNFPTRILLKESNYIDMGLRGVVKNMSLNGALIEGVFSVNVKGYGTKGLLGVNTNIKLAFYPPEREISVFGRICWMSTEENICFGIAFTRINRKNRELLMMYV